MAFITQQGSGHYHMYNEPMLIGTTIIVGQNLITGEHLVATGGWSLYSFISSFWGSSNKTTTTTTTTTSSSSSTNAYVPSSSSALPPSFNIDNYLRPFDPAKGVPM